MSAPYLIGRIADPIYAVSIGIAAAVVRIRREEKEKGRTIEQSLESLKRRARMVFEKQGVSGGGAAAGKAG